MELSKPTGSTAWVSRHRAVLVWLLVPCCLAWPLAAGQKLLLPGTLLAALAASVSGLSALRAPPSLSRKGVAFALVSMASVTVASLWATPFHAQAYVAYAAAIGLLSACKDWRALVTAAASMLVQSAALSAFMPALPPAMAPAGTGWPLVAGAVIETAALIWLTQEMQRGLVALRTEIAETREEAVARERSLRLMSEAANELASEATTARLAQEFEEKVSRLVRAACHAAQGVSSAVGLVSNVAGETVGEIFVIAQASEATSESARHVADAVVRMAASVARVTKEVRDVSDAAFRAMETAGATNMTVQQLADTAQEIGKIVRTIQGITDRTHLVALNATIEAARAGEAGKGFNVVAAEVKALARQTARATEHIQGQIAAIGTDMTQAMQAIDAIASTVADLGGITVSVAGSMDEQAEVAQALADSAARAAASTELVVSNLRTLTEGASQASAAAQDGQRDAAQLAQQCEGLELAVKALIGDLVAA